MIMGFDPRHAVAQARVQRQSFEQYAREAARYLRPFGGSRADLVAWMVHEMERAAIQELENDR